MHLVTDTVAQIRSSERDIRIYGPATGFSEAGIPAGFKHFEKPRTSAPGLSEMAGGICGIPASLRGLGPGMTLDALTFDGTPFKVSIPSYKAVGWGSTAKIFVGHVINAAPSQRVAVKVFGNLIEDHHQELLIRELKAARQVSIRGHRSILPFIGSASLGLQTAIVSHYMKNGNLLEYFKAQPNIEAVDKKKLILQVADAVNHLHVVEGLVHGDLKCVNVLVSDTEDALLADFGLSTFVEKAQTSATTILSVRQMYTVRFAAPEILRDVAGQPARLRSKTRETDVYAFGMLVLEAITERQPWADAGVFAVMHWVCSGLQPSVDITTMSGAWSIICSRCWDSCPERRPTMKEVMHVLTAYDYKPFRRLGDMHIPSLQDVPQAPRTRGTNGGAPPRGAAPSLMHLMHWSPKPQDNTNAHRAEPTAHSRRGSREVDGSESDSEEWNPWTALVFPGPGAGPHSHLADAHREITALMQPMHPHAARSMPSTARDEPLRRMVPERLVPEPSQGVFSWYCTGVAQALSTRPAARRATDATQDTGISAATAEVR